MTPPAPNTSGEEVDNTDKEEGSGQVPEEPPASNGGENTTQNPGNGGLSPEQ